MIVITATIAAKPGKWEEAKAAAAGLRTGALASATPPRVYNFFVDEDAQRLHVVEVYDSPDNLQEHLSGADFGAFGAAVEVLDIQFRGEAPASITDFVKTWAPVSFYTEL
jgi:quinol monooxygenase YgiN